ECSERANLARFSEPFDGGEGVFEVAGLIERRVEVQHIDAFDAESGERSLDRAHEVHRAESRVIGVGADARTQRGALALTTRLQPLADDVFAAPAGEAIS